MDAKKIKILCWAGWYRHSDQDYKAMFIKKHLECISEFADVHCFHIAHKKNIYWFKKQILDENFGSVVLYFIPAFFPLKHLGYLIIPLIEGVKAKRKWKDIDVFHLHVSYPFAAFTYLLEFLKIKKWLLTEHWSGYTFFDNSFARINVVLRKILSRRLWRFEKITVVSEYLKNEMRQRFPNLKDKFVVIPNVVKYPTVLKRPVSVDSVFKLLTISNLTVYPKNILFLIDVVFVASKLLPNIQLDIYGDGKDKEILLSRARELKILDNCVFFKGSVDNERISEVYAQHHALILLSRFETFSVVTAEAIAHGLPVIVSCCGAPEEYVHEKNGYLVPVNNLLISVQAILEMYQNYSRFLPNEVQATIKHQSDKEIIQEQFKRIMV